MSEKVAKVILFDADGRLFIYLRDDKQSIPYPNMWDLLGGSVEEGESVVEAGLREVQEEIGVELSDLTIFGQYTSAEGHEFTILRGKTDVRPGDVILTEGQRLTSIPLDSRGEYDFVPVLAKALNDFAKSL